MYLCAIINKLTMFFLSEVTFTTSTAQYQKVRLISCKIYLMKNSNQIVLYHSKIVSPSWVKYYVTERSQEE